MLLILSQNHFKETADMTKLVRFDWAIKYLLRNKANFDVLEGFLSELLKVKVEIETVLESEGNKKDAKDKFNRVDVLVKTANGQQIIIEVQCSTQADYLTRVLYGTSKVVCEYMREGDAYRNIRKVISVSIVFFDLGQGKDYIYRGSTTFKGVHNHDTLSLNENERKAYGQPDGLGLETPEEIFPEYYIIKVTAFKEKVKDKLDEWVYFLKNGKIEKDFNAQGIQIAAKKLSVLRLSEAERRAYEGYQDSLRDDASWALTVEIEKALAVEKAEKAQAKAEAQGRKKGREEGREQGRKEGREAGKEENKEEIALQLFKENMMDEKIAAITHLPIDRVKELGQRSR
jgi:predicted transposase/invertase (TIGR01784 family)